ncbi:Kelch repeat-containing protein [Pseudoalteromonas piscicida]|nr:kelch repeat-containing protein [Pseudoalteromonas piscicida]
MRRLPRTLAHIFLTAVFAMGSTKVLAQTNLPSQTWQTATPLPVALQEIYPSVFMDRIFVGGGFSVSELETFHGLGPTDKVYLLNPSEEGWELAPSLPDARHHVGFASNIHYLYAIGGFNGPKGAAWQPQSSVYRLDGRVERWVSAPSLPSPLAESVYATIGMNIHVIGGKTRAHDSDKNSDSTAHYVLKNNAYWSRAKPLPSPRNSAASVVIGDDIYVIGGRVSGDEPKNLDTVEVYNSKSDSWRTLAPLPVAAAGLAASVINGKIVVTGGEAFDYQSEQREGKVYASAWLYDPKLDAWRSLPDMPSPRHGHGQVSHNGLVYVIGGATKIGPQETLKSTIAFKLTDTN